MLFSILQFY